MRNDAQEEQAALATRIMRKQAALSLRVAAVFVVILVGTPLANLYAPDFMGSKVGGFTLTWLFLGIAFYPITWILSSYFVKNSNKIEEEIAKEEKQ